MVRCRFACGLGSASSALMLLTIVDTAVAQPQNTWGTSPLPRALTVTGPIQSRTLASVGIGSVLSVLGLLSSRRSTSSNIAVVSGVFASALSFTWLISVQGEAPITRIQKTLNKPIFLAILVGMTSFTMLFAVIHYIRLGRAQRIRELAARTHTHTQIFRLQDLYILRIIVIMVLGTGGLLAEHGGKMTQQQTLGWLPPMLSAATILPAAWEGRECPVDFQPGPDV